MTNLSKRITIVLLLLTGSLIAQRPSRVDDGVLRNAAKSTGEEWLSYNFTPQETRFSPLTEINTTNVGRLGLASSVEIGAGGGGQEGTPLVHDGVLFTISNWSVVFAIDLRSGKEKWRWDPEVNQAAVRQRICCGVVNRGIAIYDGKVIAPSIDGRLIALDEKTGKPVWEARVSYTTDNHTLTMAPRIAKGKVIIGAAGADYPARGFFDAYDAETGRRLWRFYTVPGASDEPFEQPAMRQAAATWPKEKIGGGGASVWDSIAYDPDLELLYVGTGNAGPWPEELRKSKGFDLLYAASILAVDVNTGQLKWYFQMVPGDEWDFDSVQHLVLADVAINGVKRKVILQANKNGFIYTLDRTDGKFIKGIPFAKVNWALGLDEKSGRPIINPEAHYTATESVNITPGPGGAHNWSPMSFNPNLGLLFVSGQSGGGFTYAVQPDFKYNPAQSNFGIVFSFGPPATANKPPAANNANATSENITPEIAAARAAAAQPPAPVPAKRKPELRSIGPSSDGGFLMAYDPSTGKERWRVQGGGAIGGGTVATAGGIVFQATAGMLRAYSADKGEKLLELKVEVPGGMGPPMTYMLDGKQYVALQVGQGRVQAGFGALPPNPDGSGPPNPRLLIYTLDGSAKP